MRKSPRLNCIEHADSFALKLGEGAQTKVPCTLVLKKRLHASSIILNCGHYIAATNDRREAIVMKCLRTSIMSFVLAEKIFNDRNRQAKSWVLHSSWGRASNKSSLSFCFEVAPIVVG